MELKNYDYESIKQLLGSAGWKILCEDIDEKIKLIEEVLLSPTTDDMFGKDEIEKLRLNNYKKAERIYLIKLKNLPQELLDTKIKLTKHK